MRSQSIRKRVVDLCNFIIQMILVNLPQIFLHLFTSFAKKQKKQQQTISSASFATKILVAALLNLLLTTVEGLKITSLGVPPHHVSGKQVVLVCRYNLENDILYSVKWYRGNYEFFRYEPGAKLPMKIFDLKGIIVDTSLSDQNNVTLRSVTRESSGKYKCEVSADEPSFHTVSKTAEMLVVDLPKSDPKITGSQSRYQVGDEVHANCTSGKSRPAASLMWYINGLQARLDNLIEYTPMQDTDGLETSTLGLQFIVGVKDFPDEVISIRCTATIAAVYWQSSEETLEGQLPQTRPALESKGVYTGSSSSTQLTQGQLGIFNLSLGVFVSLLHFFFR